ncbi:MAG: hypothetical protein WA944_09645 [Mycobacterium sp.]
MEEIRRPAETGPRRKPLRGTLVTAGVVLGILVLVAVAIYAGAFLMLAPMMQ